MGGNGKGNGKNKRNEQEECSEKLYGGLPVKCQENFDEVKANQAELKVISQKFYSELCVLQSQIRELMLISKEGFEEILNKPTDKN